MHTFTYQKTFLHTHFCLFLKSLKAFSVSLNCALWFFCFQEQFLTINEIRLLKTNWELTKFCWLKKGSEECSHPRPTFKMELFTKTVSRFQLLTIFTRNSILHVWKSSKYASEDGCEKQLYYLLPMALSIFQTKIALSTPSIISAEVSDVFWAMFENLC